MNLAAMARLMELKNATMEIQLLAMDALAVLSILAGPVQELELRQLHLIRAPTCAAMARCSNNRGKERVL